MQFEEEILISASPERIFSFYADVARWASWDPDVKSAFINGGFESGATGRLRPSRGPEAGITLSEVIPYRSFTVESRLVLCEMRFEHELSVTTAGTRVVHRVSFRGLLSPFFGRIIGARIGARLPRTLAGLKAAAERPG